MNSMFKIGGTLLAFCAVSALLLAGTDQITAPIIEQRNEKANNEARVQVLPEAKDFKEVDNSSYKSAGVDTISEVFEGANGSDEIGQVLPEAKEFKEVESSSYKSSGAATISEVFEGSNGSDQVGYTIKSKPSGYGGEIEITIGISKDGKITGVNIGNNTETPGLGAKAADPAFNGQYKGKEAKELEVIKSGSPGENEVKAISGATITSKAVTSGVNDAVKVFESLSK